MKKGKMGLQKVYKKVEELKLLSLGPTKTVGHEPGFDKQTKHSYSYKVTSQKAKLFFFEKKVRKKK